ncbi:MAG: hypothetical protein BRD39_02625, partial [Bacteroidetes bacterium QH_9_64_21]
MRFRYTEWDPVRHGSQKPLFEKLLDLFQDLLEHTAGDAEEALDWMKQLDEQHDLTEGSDKDLDDFIEELKKRGYLEEGEEGETVEITARTERSLRQSALEEIFNDLQKGGMGDHRTPYTGQGDERLPETKDWQFGDDLSNLDVTGTLSNSFKRSGVGDNWHLSEDDFQVHKTDHHASMATVLMIDLSHSMVLYGEDRITPARRVAMALSELIMTKYPKDSLDIVAFGN